MAEIVGIVSGIAGLINLTVEVFGLSYRYITEVRAASGNMRRFLGELESLKGVLIKIERLGKAIEDTDTVGDEVSILLSEEHSQQFLELLGFIRKELEAKLPSGSFRSRVKPLTWPFSEENSCFD